jgi:deoxyribodipyrimidine photo-lyase
MDEPLRKLNGLPFRQPARYVLYWSRWNRRADSNHALLFAADLTDRLELPLLFLETLGFDRPCASDRFHTFQLQGVPATAARLHQTGIGFAFHLQRRMNDGPHPAQRLAREAAAVVTDECPLPDPQFDVAAFAVDSSCIVPAAAIQGRAYAAYSLRPRIHRLLPLYLKPVPEVKVRHPFEGPIAIETTEVTEAGIPALVAACEIDHGVRPALGVPGGRTEALRRLNRFLRFRLWRYAREKNEPAARVTSELSPYLHYGHISALEAALAARDYATRNKLVTEEFLEELIVRRELAFNFVRHSASPDSLEELPDWARATLDAHRGDARRPVYSPDQFEAAATHDALWNAAQRELLLCGTIHGYYRMYWGKKILEWSPTPEEALATMVHLHDRYALDGCDPNTYANLLWCFGLHDRPWPERPIYGTVRSMSLAGMRRKTDVDGYLHAIEHLEREGPEENRE